MQRKEVILGTIHYLAEFDEVNQVISIPFDNEVSQLAIENANKIMEDQNIFIDKMSLHKKLNRDNEVEFYLHLHVTEC